RLIVMLEDLVLFGEFANGRAVFEKQAVGIAEVDRSAPFMVDHWRDVDAFLDEHRAFVFEFLDVVAPEGEVVEGSGEALGAVDVGGPLLRDPGDLFGAHEGDQGAVAGVQEDVFDLSALRGLYDVGPRDLPSELAGVEIDSPFEIEGGKAEMMHSGAFHRLVLLSGRTNGSKTI